MILWRQEMRRRRRRVVSQKYRVVLTEGQRQELTRLTRSGQSSARTPTRARVLLKADEAEGSPAWTNAAIAEAVEVNELTVTRIRKRFVEGGLEGALHRQE